MCPIIALRAKVKYLAIIVAWLTQTKKHKIQINPISHGGGAIMTTDFFYRV